MATHKSIFMPFWQPREQPKPANDPTELRSKADQLLTQYFDKIPKQKIALIVADIVKEKSAEYYAKTTDLERDAWLHAEAFRRMHALLDRRDHRLVKDPLNKLPASHAALADLLAEAEFLKAKVDALKSEEQFDVIAKRALIG